MIEVVINYDQKSKVFKVYEPTTDTLLITASLTESFVKLSEFLKQRGMIMNDILQSQEISYHIDSPTFIAMVESNVNLLKRLNTGPSGFTTSSQRFGVSQSQPNSLSQQLQAKKGIKRKGGSTTRSGSGIFSKSTFRSSNKKFGG